MNTPEAIIIGAGPSAVALAHTLKCKLGFDDFTIYEKLDGPGGTWRTNTYPGVGCDIPTILYSFSFNQNPSWSKELCEGPEILKYIESTVDKFDLRKHMQFQVECVTASWNAGGYWEARFRDLVTGVEFSRKATIFISAVGGISYPRDVEFPGMSSFKGDIFHTARWNHNFDYANKRLAVIGNGCSAAQVVPAVAEKAAFVKQYARSAQWYHERPNRDFTAAEKWCFKYIPGWLRLVRLRLFLSNDSLVGTYMSGEAAAGIRARVEAQAKQYIKSRAPEKYHEALIPQFPLGCKRRIFDPGYLASLNRSNVEFAPHGIKSMDETGITSTDGVKSDFDAIILATGFQVQQFLVPMKVYGRDGIALDEQWEEKRGAQAFMGTFVNNFPNFAIMFGPNTFPAHNSVIFASEVQAEYLARTLVAPIIDGRTPLVEVKGTAEDQWVSRIHQQLRGTVFSAGCSNWYINNNGRNSASWPGYASTYWKETLVPHSKAFLSGPSWTNVNSRTFMRWFRDALLPVTGVAVCVGAWTIGRERLL